MTPEALNLRTAANPQQSCATCGNAMPGPQGQLMCNVLQMPVQPQMVSDAWAPPGKEESAEQGAPAMPPMDLTALMGPAGGA